MTLWDMWRFGMPTISPSGEIALLMVLVGLGVIWVIVWIEDARKREGGKRIG